MNRIRHARRLRLDASLASPCGHNKIVPPYGHTPNKDAYYRTLEGLLLESHPDSRTILPSAESGGIERAGAEGEQLRHAPGVALLHRAATAILGLLRALPLHRAGNGARENVGEEEAGVGSHSAFVRGVTPPPSYEDSTRAASPGGSYAGCLRHHRHRDRVLAEALTPAGIARAGEASLLPIAIEDPPAYPHKKRSVP